MRKHCITLLAVLCAMLAASCGGAGNAGGKKILSVSIEPQKYIVSAIAADEYDIEVVVPRGTSPETFDPAPSTLVRLASGTAYIRMGFLPFETAFADRLAASGKGMKTMNMSAGIETIADSCGHGHAHGPHTADPHTWMSIANVKIMADSLCAFLQRLNPDNKAIYASRLDSLHRVLDAKDAEIRSLLPESDNAFMIYHPVMSYFARDYGLQQIVIEEGGKEPSPETLRRSIDQAREAGVRYIFVQPEFDRRNAEVIAAEAGATVEVLNPLAYDFTDEMVRFARKLAHDR